MVKIAIKIAIIQRGRSLKKLSSIFTKEKLERWFESLVISDFAVTKKTFFKFRGANLFIFNNIG